MAHLYTVTWSARIYADSHYDAALLAQAHQYASMYDEEDPWDFYEVWNDDLDVEDEVVLSQCKGLFSQVAIDQANQIIGKLPVQKMEIDT